MNLSDGYHAILKQMGRSQQTLYPEEQRSWMDLVTEHISGLNADEEIKERLRSEFLRYGPLDELLDDCDVTEIIINRVDQIWYERQGRLCRWKDQFLGPVSHRNIIERICHEANAIADLNIPFADAAWRDFRIHVAVNPVVESYSLNLRRRALSTLTWEKLIEDSWCNRQQFQILERLVSDQKNIMVVGPTGSGKTTILNLLLKLSSAWERAVIIEDTPELDPPNTASICLKSRIDSRQTLSDIDLSQLVRQALRMRPDRLVLGEVRGAEAKDLLLALATGHRGCMGTLHADSPQQALLRLEMLVQLGAPQWSLSCVRRLIQLSIDSIVVVEKIEGRRTLKGIYQIGPHEQNGFTLDEIQV